MKHRWYTLFYILKVSKVTLCIWRRLVFWGFSAKEILRYSSDVVNLLNYINMSTHRITITSFSTSIMPKKPLVPIRRNKMKKLASHLRKLWTLLFDKEYQYCETRWTLYIGYLVLVVYCKTKLVMQKQIASSMPVFPVTCQMYKNATWVISHALKVVIESWYKVITLATGLAQPMGIKPIFTDIMTQCL